MIRENTMDEIKLMHGIITISNDSNTNTNTNIQESYRKPTLEILISATIHTFIMAIFEIYFYFNFIIIIEKELFMNKINEYTLQFNQYYITHVTPEQQTMLTIIFPQKNAKNILQVLYIDYQKSLHEQKQLLNTLLINSYKMVVVITSFLILFLTTGMYYYKGTLKWKNIIIENILMVICLGVFEYIFFMTIILHYSPVTDEEIKYAFVKQLVEPFYKNTTNYYLL